MTFHGAYHGIYHGKKSPVVAPTGPMCVHHDTRPMTYPMEFLRENSSCAVSNGKYHELHHG